MASNGLGTNDTAVNKRQQWNNIKVSFLRNKISNTTCICVTSDIILKGDLKITEIMKRKFIKKR